MNTKIKKAFPFLFTLVFILYSLFLVRDVLQKKLGGTFTTHAVPKEYQELNSFLGRDQSFFRTLWIPQVQRYGNFSYRQPAIWGNDFLKNINLQKQIAILKNPSSQKWIQEAGIKYIIVPSDSEGEIFLKDRKYDESIYRNTVKEIEKIPWLLEKKFFGKITVFEVPNPKDRFWTESDTKLEWKMIDPTHYQINAVGGEVNGVLIFSEGFDVNWIAKVNESKIQSQKYHEYFNSFPINSSSNIDIYYEPQNLVNKGLIISVIFCLVFLILLSKNRNL